MRFSWWEAIHDAHSEQGNYLPLFRSWWLYFILFLIVKITPLNHGYYHFILLFSPLGKNYSLYLQGSLTLKANCSDHVSFRSLGPLRKDSQERTLCKKYSQNTYESRTMEAGWEGQKLKEVWVRKFQLSLLLLVVLICRSYSQCREEAKRRGSASHRTIQTQLKHGYHVPCGYGRNGSSILKLYLLGQIQVSSLNGSTQG